MKRTILFFAAALSMAACGAPGGDDDSTGDDVAELPDNCPDLFAQDIVPEWRVTLSDTEWAAMQDEFLNREQREMDGLEVSPYHPAEIRYVVGSDVSDPIPNAMIRLKGSTSWLQTIQLDDNPKMQFVLAFNEVDPDARFMGVRKVELDMPRSDQTFLHQRVSLAYLRAAGLPAQCANSARAVINGEYYGLYTNLERQDKEWLQRLYPDADNGDLWKSGRIIKTNEDTFTWDRLDQLWHSPDMAGFAPLVDMDASIHEWAAEAVIGDADGYQNGRANVYLYDHPTRGFIWMPSDLDTAIDWDFLSPDASPIFPPALFRNERDWFHYLTVLGDEGGYAQYTAALADMRSRYDTAAMQQRIDAWAAQIADAANEDPHKPFSNDDHAFAVSRMRDYGPARVAYLDRWLACDSGEGGEDTDGDGYDMCHDCDDRNGAVHPGAAEVCNMLDDDCDGHADNVDDVSVCE
jgi:hypothetical protein